MKETYETLFQMVGGITNSKNVILQKNMASILNMLLIEV
jgi:hypothetical protein